MNIIPTSKRAAFNVTTGVMSYFILPQNGVVQESMHYDSVDSSSEPKSLVVSSTNVYATKNLWKDSEDIDDRSLPCPPDMQAESEVSCWTAVSSCPAGDEVLENDTRHLITRFLTDSTGLSKSQWNESGAQATMKRVVGGVLENYGYAYRGMFTKLSLDDRSDDASFVSAVAKSLFADGTTNWGRIVSLVAFGAAACRNLKERGRENCVELVGQEISTYLLSDQRDWLVKNNGWDGFVEFFRVADPESTVRNTPMAFAEFGGFMDLKWDTACLQDALTQTLGEAERDFMTQ